MKCYTGTKEGIQSHPDEKLGRVVFLGEKGRGRNFVKIAISKKNPCEVDSYGIIRECKLENFSYNDSEFTVLAKNNSPSDLILVRIDTNDGYCRNCNGVAMTFAGEPKFIACGNGAFGEAGRIGNFMDVLLVLHPEDAIKVNPTRGASYILWVHEGKIVKGTIDEYKLSQLDF